MTNKVAFTVAAVFVSTCALSVAFFGRRWLRRSTPARDIPEQDFLEIMKLISRAVFSRLFEAAQVSQRVTARSIDQHFSALMSNIRMELNHAQSVILAQLGISESDLRSAQSRYYNKGNSELDTVIDSIPRMFESVAGGEFPVLPDCVFNTESAAEYSDEELLKVIRQVFAAKANIKETSAESVEEEIIMSAGFSDPAQLYNESSKRINSPTGQYFRAQLMQTVIDCQSVVKSMLDQ
jgi:hypothetical protein